MAEKRSKAQRAAITVAAATLLAAPAEGLRQVAYHDPGGVLTVCYGHTGADVDPSKVYSLDECKTLLNADMLRAVDQVEACRPGMPESVTTAFSDAVFNLGPTVACTGEKSTAARLLAAGDYASACRELPKWNKVRIAGVAIPFPGLTKRRNAEMAHCLGGLS